MKLQALLLTAFIGTAFTYTQEPTPSDTDKEKNRELTALVLKKYYVARASLPESYSMDTEAKHLGEESAEKFDVSEHEAYGKIKNKDGSTRFFYIQNTEEPKDLLPELINAVNTNCSKIDIENTSNNKEYPLSTTVILKDNYTECRMSPHYKDPLNLSKVGGHCFVDIPNDKEVIDWVKSIESKIGQQHTSQKNVEDIATELLEKEKASFKR